MMYKSASLPLLLSVLVSLVSPMVLADDSGERDGENNGQERAKAEDPSKCVTHTKQARFVSGYDHLVHIKNGCSKSVTCDVSTNVNPKKQSTRLASGASTTVLTYRGSPAREFEATVDCRF